MDLAHAENGFFAPAKIASKVMTTRHNIFNILI